MSSRANQPDTAADIELRDLLTGPERPAFLMLAGAGSGKTTSLVKAIRNVCVHNAKSLRQRNQKVACITYTEVAAAEVLADVGGDQAVWVSTVHSFLWSVIKPFKNDIKRWAEDEISSRLDKLRDTRSAFGSRVQQKARDKNAADIERYEAQLNSLAEVSSFTYGLGPNLGDGVLGHEDVIRLGTHLIQERPLLRKLLARQYPYVFVDESQDTFAEVVEALKAIREEQGSSFSLGFFGDPMQKIYARGVGNIDGGADWARIKKPENFRASDKVLEVINHIRLIDKDDEIRQESGLPPEKRREGAVYYFVLPADENRNNTLAAVRAELEARRPGKLWTADNPEDGAKILVIAHRMAARRLGFESLYSAFHDSGSARLSQAFDEGTAWPLRVLLDVLLPLASSARSEQMKIIRAKSPAFARLRSPGIDAKATLASLRDAVDSLQQLVHSGGPGSVGKILDLAERSGIVSIDPRMSSGVEVSEREVVVAEEAIAVLKALRECDISEVRRYEQYIKEASPYSTHQGVKGTEYSRVLVVLDDEEGRHNQFSYDKVLGLKPLSKTDEKNLAEGRESVIERTRRLLYVCCSRSSDELAVVLYAADVPAAVAAVRSADLPGSDLVRVVGYEAEQVHISAAPESWT